MSYEAVVSQLNNINHEEEMSIITAFVGKERGKARCLLDRT